MLRSRIGKYLLVVSVTFMVFLYAAFSKYSSTFFPHGNSCILRREEEFNGREPSYIEKTTEDILTKKIKELSKDLRVMQKSFVSSSSNYKKLGSHVQKCFELLKILNQNISDENMFDDSQMESVTQQAKKEVCPEKFMGKLLNYGYPLFRKGFERVDCKEFVPIEKLVTIIAILPIEFGKPAQSYLEILQGVAKYYPGMRVILATKKDLEPSIKSEISKLKISLENHIINDAGQGALLKELVGKVSTPYVLIASNITHFDDDINLGRMVRVLSYEARVTFVGGAHRNLRGEWDIGCQQVSFKNMTARYMGGYYRSFNECIVCDYLSGSIMARSETFKELQFDSSMKYGAFHDLFWRFKKQMPDNIAASCPDVMFNLYSREIDDVELVTFANKHLIHRIIDPDDRVRWYGCRKGYSYTSAELCKRGPGMGLSPADMENLADVMKFFMQACNDSGAFCEFQSGTMMGAVKFNGVLPWDIDGDIVFLDKNFSVIEKLKSKIEKAGYTLSIGYRPSVKGGHVSRGYFALKTTNWKVDLWGFAEFGSQMDVAKGVIPTKVMFSGQWVNHPHNPGLFARNRYGNEIYQHQEHWRRHKHDSAWTLYHSGHFLECPEPGHSSCLDQYSADGNMQFSDYCPS